MAYQFIVSQKPATIPAGLYQLIQVMVAAGWTIKKSGDGLSAFSSSGSVFSNGAVSGANGWLNGSGTATVWAVLQDPGGTREVCIAQGSTNANWAQVAESPGGLFSGGSATAAATASDQWMAVGTSLSQNAGTTWSTSGTSTVYHAFASTSYPYSFGIWVMNSGSTSCVGGIICEGMTGLTTGNDTPSEYVYNFGSSPIGTTNPLPCTGRANSTTGTHKLFFPTSPAISTSLGNRVSKHDLLQCPITVQTGSTGTEYLRGFTTALLYDLHYQTASQMGTLDYAGTSKSRVRVNAWAMPWDGSTPVLS